jgi:putative transposase
MRPSRELFRQADQTYFASFQTAQRQCFFRNERWSSLFLATLTRYMQQLGLHDFVIMPDHVHLLLSPQVPLERAVQLVKGGFSFQARRELQWPGDIWQAGFSDHRVRNITDWENHCEYIRKNALSKQSEGKALCGKDSSLSLHPLPQWLKPNFFSESTGGAEAPPLQTRPTLLEEFYRQHSPPSPAGRTDIHTCKDAADLFRKLGI